MEHLPDHLVATMPRFQVSFSEFVQPGAAGAVLYHAFVKGMHNLIVAGMAKIVQAVVVTKSILFSVQVLHQLEVNRTCLAESPTLLKSLTVEVS